MIGPEQYLNIILKSIESKTRSKTGFIYLTGSIRYIDRLKNAFKSIDDAY